VILSPLTAIGIPACSVRLRLYYLAPDENLFIKIPLQKAVTGSCKSRSKIDVICSKNRFSECRLLTPVFSKTHTDKILQPQSSITQNW
jgi:hypothetical protein